MNRLVARTSSARPALTAGRPTRTLLARLLAPALALLLMVGLAEAHLVPDGVGSQVWFDVRPSGLTVTYNMGFSSILGYDYMLRMDEDHNGNIDALEKARFLRDFGPKMAKGLELYVDGERVPLRLIRQSGVGMRGDVQRVAFDTFFTFEADVELGTAKHKISWREGNFPSEISQQLIYVPAEHGLYESFKFEQRKPEAGPYRKGDYIVLQGRDVEMRAQFKPEAIIKERAERLAAERVATLEGVLAAYEAAVIRPELEEGLSRFAFEEVSLVGLAADDLEIPETTAALAPGRPSVGGAGGIPIPAQVEMPKGLGGGKADGGSGSSAGGGSSGSGGSPGVAAGDSGGSDRPAKKKSLFDRNLTEEFEDVLKAVNEPFSLIALLTFVVLGAWHARTPGHGKTMVAAYLIGRRGTVWEAVKLGLMVTFTHTISLYTIGLTAVYVIDRMYTPEEFSKRAFLASVNFWITFGSGLVLVVFGLHLFRRRYERFKSGRLLPEGIHEGELAQDHDHNHDHGDGHKNDHGDGHSHRNDHDHGDGHAHKHGDGHTHAHDHKHGDGHTHAHDHEHGDGHTHAHDQEHGDGHTHDHDHKHGDGHTHAHDHGHTRDHSHGHGHGHPHDHSHSHAHSHDHDHGDLSAEEHAALHANEFNEVHSFWDLMTVAVSGGLVPCPMGVLIIIYSVQPGHEQKFLQCLTYLIGFSIGLGGAITSLAVLMVLFRDRFAASLSSGRRRTFLRFAPLGGALAIAALGVALTYESFDPKFKRLRAQVFGDPPAITAPAAEGD